MQYFWVYIISSVFVAIYLGRIMFQKRRIEIEGRLPGRIVGTAVVFLIAAAIILIKRGWENTELLYMLGAMFVAVSVFCFVKSGIGPAGIYINGKLISFSKMDYFSFESEMKDLYRVRIHTPLKDTALYFKQSDKEAIREYFALAKVPDFDKMGAGDFKKKKK